MSPPSPAAGGRGGGAAAAAAASAAAAAAAGRAGGDPVKGLFRALQVWAREGGWWSNEVVKPSGQTIWSNQVVKESGQTKWSNEGRGAAIERRRACEAMRHLTT